MKKVLLFLALLSLTATIFAQKQTGYVRTIHKASKPAKYINGAVITSKENNNVAKSKDGGSFEIPVATVKGKKGYTITKVELNGYNLVDEKLLNKFKTYSLSPIEIVLISKKDEEIQTKALIEKREKALKAEYEKQIKELKGDYSKIEQLNRNYEQQLKDLPDLVKRLVYLDYKNLTNELDISIAEAYENGDFAKAIELINQKPDLKTRSEQNKQLKEAVEKETETIIRECDIKIDYFKSIFKYDSALYYMEIKLEQDPENIGCLFEAGEIARVYVGNYDKALEYYDKALNIALKFEEKNEKMVAILYNSKGYIYDAKREYNEAFQYFEKALLAAAQDVTDIVLFPLCCINLGNVCTYSEEYDKALDYYEEAIKWSFSDSDSGLTAYFCNIAICHANIAQIYYRQGERERCIDKCEFALPMLYHCIENNIDVEKGRYAQIANIYHLLGQCYNDGTQLSYYKKALEIYTDSLDLPTIQNIIDMAGVKCDIGYYHFHQEKYNYAEQYFKEALSDCLKVVNPDHPTVIHIYHRLIELYIAIDSFDMANKGFEYVFLSDVFTHYYRSNIREYMDIYFLRTQYYFKKKLYTQAEELLNTMLDVASNTKDYKIKSIYESMIYLRLGKLYYIQEKYDNALAYYKNASFNLTGYNIPTIQSEAEEGIAKCKKKLEDNIAN